MAHTMQQLQSLLGPDEPNYSQIGAALQPDDVANLETLAAGTDVMLATKATYALSLIGTREAKDALERVAGSPHGPVRIAVASGLPNLRNVDVTPLATRLLGDADVSVRKGAVKATKALHLTAVARRLEQVATSDPVPGLRTLAKATLDAIR